tara:strand:+ start:938 stop:1270 length:333 start_codon:yes stop_codon:yes gene_type:complete
MGNKEEYGDFCKLFGVTPRNRVIEFFLQMESLDFTIGDVAKETGLNRATTYNTMEILLEEGYVVPTRKVSAGQLYKLNSQKNEIKVLLEVFDLLLDRIVEEYTKKKLVHA